MGKSYMQLSTSKIKVKISVNNSTVKKTQRQPKQMIVLLLFFFFINYLAWHHYYTFMHFQELFASDHIRQNVIRTSFYSEK